MSRALIAPQLIPLASICGLVLAGVAVSFFTLWRAHTLLSRIGGALGHVEPSYAADLDLLKQELQVLRTQMQDTRQQAPPALPPAPRSGLNLEKRSQALRLHRRGEAPADIASTLELPLQEVELLIKVHRIVLRSI